MNTNKKTTINIDMILGVIFAAILTALKLTDTIGTPWIMVFLPIWFPMIMAVIYKILVKLK